MCCQGAASKVLVAEAQRQVSHLPHRLLSIIIYPFLYRRPFIARMLSTEIII
jgi:hypothetical protein